MRNVAILCLLVVFFPTLAFSQQTDASANVLTSDSETDALLEKYVEESQKLSEEFAPVYEHLRKEGIVLINSKKVKDIERWEREYYQPLFERSKQAMLRVADCDDYLSMWEKKVPQRIIEATEGLGDKVRKTPSVPYFGVHERGKAAYAAKMKLLTLCELSVVLQNREEILKDSVYEDTEQGARIREPRIANVICNPWELVGRYEATRQICEKIGLWYIFPPREISEIAGETTFDSSWHAMAIYSFKNDRSENILYELITDPSAEFELADWAVYYLALSPNSARFLPHVNKEIQERIVSFQKEFPQEGAALPDLDGATRKPYLNNFRSLFKSVKDRYIFVSTYGVPEKPGENAIQKYLTLNLIRRLLILKQSLEFNEKVPIDEKKRFEVVRREYAISWALTPKETEGPPVILAGIRNHEERFKIYMAEYEPPPFIGRSLSRYIFYRRDADSSHPQDQWDAKSFYERELTRKDYYSEVQIEYIQKQLEIIDKNEKALEFEKQREREKKRNK